MSERSGTTDRILDAAEELFAQKGFAETSLRAITGRAGVNLAAVNYHFGSKEALIQSVFERFLDPFCSELSRRLDGLEPQAPDLGALLTLVSGVAVQSQGRDPHRVAVFFRLCGLAYTQAQGHLRRQLLQRYGDLMERVRRLLAQAAPDVPPLEMFWRFHFALGATVFAMSSMDSLLAISRSDFGASLEVADVSQRLLPFVLGGLQA